MNTPVNTKNKPKLFWVNLIKVFATIFVIMQHCIAQEWVRLTELGGTAWNILNFLAILNRISIPIFIMCSGMGMLQRERSIKSIFMNSLKNLIFIYIAWMLVYGVIDMCSLISSGSATLRTVINIYLKAILFGRYHTWYIMALIGLYLVTPFLYEIAKNKSLLKYFLLLSVIFTIFVPYIAKIEALERLNTVIQYINMRFVVGYSLYYLLGYYLSSVKLTKLQNVINGIVFLASVGAVTILSGSQRSIIGTQCQDLYTEFSFFGFIIATSFFLLFKGLFEHVTPKPALEKSISIATTCGIGVYLFHPMILFLIEDLQGLWCILGGLGVWILSWIIMLIIYHIPVVSRIFLGKK